MVRVLVLALLALCWNPVLMGAPSHAQAQAGAPPTYDLVDLGTLGGATSSGYDIDADGRVVGQSQTKGNAGCGEPEESAEHAFLWEDGVMTDLGTLGGTNSGAFAFGPDGRIVGWSETPDGDTHAALWTADGAIVDLGMLNGADSAATAVNAAGQVVGISITDSDEFSAFLVEDGQMATVARLDRATAIDEDGWILGEREGGGSVLVRGAQVTDLAPIVNAVGMDAAGRVYGAIRWDDETVHAAIWDEGEVTDLGALPDRPDSYVKDVNSSGQAVGVTVLPMICGHATEATLWHDGRLLVLSNQVIGPATQLIDATSINDRGQILATMYADGELHAVVLTPHGTVAG